MKTPKCHSWSSIIANMRLLICHFWAKLSEQPKPQPQQHRGILIRRTVEIYTTIAHRPWLSNPDRQPAPRPLTGALTANRQRQYELPHVPPAIGPSRAFGPGRVRSSIQSLAVKPIASGPGTSSQYPPARRRRATSPRKPSVIGIHTTGKMSS